MPCWRPSCSSAFGPWSFASNGYVPGGEVPYWVVVRRSGGFGARPDGISLATFRVLSAKSLDLFVISFFGCALHVIVSQQLNESF
jgi:hypothetical protein